LRSAVDWKAFAMFLSCGLLCGLTYGCTAGPVDEPYLVGRSLADITLPVVGVPMLGFVHADQISEGLLQRQFARCFVVADAAGRTHVALVACDLAFPTHTLKCAVLERLREKLGDRYGYDNLVLACTHTHSAPGGYHHHFCASRLGGPFFIQCFDALVDGITESVLVADADLKPGRILFAQGDVEGASVNRARVAYMKNPAAERARYSSDVDATMTLLKFVRAEGTVGLLNWFPVHGTSMNYDNRLISGDNKGYAAYAVEQGHGTRYTGKQEFVAAFDQSNAGDVTPNLNHNNTGPGKNDFESTQIIGARQAREAERLLDHANVPLRGSIEVRHAFVDFSRLAVSNEFTGAGEKRTCSSALGYAFAAGPAEDGGGHRLFREGEKEQRPVIDATVRTVVPELSPNAELRECQKPKAVLFATGLPRPPLQEQILPLGIVRIGQLVLVVGPAEFTTMAGRRIRAAVARELGVATHFVVIAGYANDYAGYVTTHEEYESQRYEGGHTLFGPWTEAAYRQEFVRLAHALKTGQSVETRQLPEDMRKRKMPQAVLDGPDETPPGGSKFGDAVLDADERYAPGDGVTVRFWTGSPVNGYQRTDHFMAVERFEPEKREWKEVFADFDWDTTCRWQQIIGGPGARPEKDVRPPGMRIAPVPREPRPDPYQVTLSWQTHADTPLGTYRLVHFGRFKKDGTVVRFTTSSRSFQVDR
jgi:neutral ceramidase